MAYRRTGLLSSLSLLAMASFVFAPLPATAQQQSATAQGSNATTKTDSLPMPVEEIIRRFAQHESEFKVVRGNYTYTQDVLFEEVSPIRGEFRQVSDIVFTPQGKRYEQVTYAPVSTLHMILSPEDMSDIENLQPFVLTTEDLPKYDVRFLKTEAIDELKTYVFQVSPKRIEKNKRYFEGTVWVDEHDLAVVKSDGKAVPEIKDNRYPRFVTYRENIEGAFWFPTYTHADDILRFPGEDIHVRMTVRYKNYKRFGSTIKIGPSREIDAAPANSQNPQSPAKK